MSIGVLVNRDLSVATVGGYMVQAMPGTEEAVLDVVERNLSVLPPVLPVKDGEDATGILQRVINGLFPDIHEPLI